MCRYDVETSCLMRGGNVKEGKVQGPKFFGKVLATNEEGSGGWSLEVDCNKRMLSSVNPGELPGTLNL